MLETVVTLVTQVTDGVQDFLGGKAKLQSYNSFASFGHTKNRRTFASYSSFASYASYGPKFFRRRFGSYSSYTSYGWCHRIFGSKGQVTQVMQVTRQFFFGEGLLVTVVTVITQVTQVTDGVQDFLGGKAKLRSYNSFTSYWQKKSEKVC